MNENCSIVTIAGFCVWDAIFFFGGGGTTPNKYICIYNIYKYRERGGGRSEREPLAKISTVQGEKINFVRFI